MFPGGFTVLMAVYSKDDPLLFERAVASVFGNTLKPDDFLLVVDGEVPAPIETRISQFERIHHIRTVRLALNVGLAEALNAGLPSVRTAWAVRADSDDVNLPDRFERQAKAIADSGESIDLIGGLIAEVDRSGRLLAVRDVPLGHREIVARLRTRNPFNHMTVAFRVSLAIAAGGYPALFLKEDYGLWALMIARGARCANLDRVLVHATTGRDMYRRRGKHTITSERDLQLHLWRLGHKGVLSAALTCGVRVSFSLLPAWLRGWVYERLLRERPQASQVFSSPHAN